MRGLWALIERSYPLLVALLLVALALPVWLADWLPLARWGDVLTSLDVMWRMDDPNASYAGRYIPPAAFAANTATLRIAALLGPLIGTAAVAKLLASFGVIALPLAMTRVARGFGRSRWLIFVLAPLAWGAAMHEGALDVVVALPFLFWALASVQRLTDEDRASSSRARAAVALVALLFGLLFIDLTIFVAAWLLTLVLLLASTNLRGAWVRLPAWIAPLPLVGYFWARADFGVEVTPPKGLMDVGLPAERFLSFPHDTLGILNDSLDDRVLLLMLGLWFVATLMPRSPKFSAFGQATGSSPGNSATPAAEANNEAEHWSRYFRVEILAVAAIVLYLFTPNRWGEITWLGNRFGILALSLMMLTPRIDWSVGRRRWAVIGFVATAAVYVTLINVRLTVFSLRTADRLSALIEGLPKGSRLGLGTRLGDAWPTGHNAIKTLAAGMHALHNGREVGRAIPVTYQALRHRPGSRLPVLSHALLATNMVYAFDHIMLDDPGAAKLLRLRPGIRERSKWGPWTLFSVAPRRAVVEAVPGGAAPVSYRWRCPLSHHLMGLDLSVGKSGNFVGVRPLCRRWQAGSNKSKPMVGPPWGTRTDERELRCPPDTIVIGLRGQRALKPSQRLTQLRLICASSGDAKGYVGHPIETDEVKAPAEVLPVRRTDFSILCPHRRLAVGIRILEGSGPGGTAFSGLGLACLPHEPKTTPSKETQ